MRDDFESAAWAESHQHVSAALHALIHKVAYAFEALRDIQYDAPWRHLRH